MPRLRRSRSQERERAVEHFEEWSPHRDQLFAGQLTEEQKDALMHLYARDVDGVDEFLALEERGE